MSCSSSTLHLHLPLSPPIDRLTDSLSPPKQNLKTPTIRSRLSKLCQQGQPHLARQLFDTLPRPSTVIWNTIIIGFIFNNMPQEAILIYTQMKKTSRYSDFDSYTYSSTLKACALTQNLKVGKAVHCHFIRCVSNPSRIVYNSLLNMYASCSSSVDSCYVDQYDLVRKVFRVMRKRNVVAWNTLVSWYVKTGRYTRAVKQFVLMMRNEIKPSPVSFVNVFPALSGFGERRVGDAVYGMVVKFGREYVDDMFVVSSVINMYADIGCLDSAKKVFDGCLERNTEVWNTMIGGCLQNNCYVEAIDLFLEAIHCEQTAIDDVSFVLAVTAVSQLQQLGLAQQLHAYTIKCLSPLPVMISNAVIVMYSRCSRVDMSFKVFELMLEQDVVSWNTMVSSFVQNGLDYEGLMLVYEMQKRGVMVDSVTISALLSAASNLRHVQIGKQTHAYLLRHMMQFEGMDSYLVDMYAKCGLIESSQRVFEESNTCDRDVATWNAMIAGLTQNRLIIEALVAFRQMLRQNLKPNAVTLASLLPACNTIGNISFGKQLHGYSVRRSLDQNVFVGTALIDMYSKSGSITYAENVFMRAYDKNVITYTTMILGYGQHGMAESALSLYYLMLQSGLKPDAVTFVAVLSACGYAGFVDQGLKLYQSMIKDHNIRPSPEHYCCVTDMLGKAGRVVEAYEFVKELGEEGDVLEIWGSLLGACKIHKHFDLAKVVAKKLLELEARNSLSGYHTLLSNIYAEEGKWKHVDNVRKAMREKGLRKDVGCSWIETAGLAHCFVSRDQKHPQSEKICEMLDGLFMNMKDSGYTPSFEFNQQLSYESEG